MYYSNQSILNENGFCDKLEQHYEDVVILKYLNINYQYNFYFRNQSNNIHSSNRLLCIIYTMESNHNDAMSSIINTWGSKCTGLLIFSNLTDYTIPTISIPHDGEESYNNIWRKIVSIWKYIYQYYLDEFDWFFISGYDTYVIIENLIELLTKKEIVTERNKQNGMYIGRRFYFDNFIDTFNSGGPGYIIDCYTLMKLSIALYSYENICNIHDESSAEDVYISNCLQKLNIFPMETRDLNGRERFHHLHLI